MRRITFAAIVAVAAGSAAAEAETLHVPGDYPTIQAAIDAASVGDEVVIADGICTGEGNKNLDFGGKAITVRSASGDPATCIIDCEHDGRGFYFHSGETRLASVRDLTITNGRVSGDNGGAISCVSSSPTIIDCVFLTHQANEGSGGGIYSEGGSPLIKNCRFDYCHCDAMGLPGEAAGGGVYCLGGTPQIIANHFVGCSAQVWCTDGGGAIGFHETDIVIRGNDIHNCGAHGAGGGILGHDSQVDISGNIIAQCFGFHYGGAVALWDSSATISQNLIIDNEAYENGGGIYLGGDSNVEIAFCTIIDNTAATPEFSYGSGGGVCVSSSSEALVQNCIIWQNTAVEGQQIHVYGSGIATVSYCDVQGGWSGDGNIDEDPLFADPEGGDYRLSAGSPCLDAGDPAYPLQLREPDLDGHARLLCGRVDMGAYEFGIGDYDCDHIVDLTDFTNWDTCITGPDAGPYGAGCRAFDFEFDLDVDLADFAGFQNVFGM